MADALRAIGRMVPAFRAALTVHLIEASSRLRESQADRIEAATWHDGLATVPDGPAIVIANEFLDALPIRQFVRHADGWRERHVRDGCFVEMPATPDIRIDDAALPEGAIVESGAAARDLTAVLARRLSVQGGAALFLDYGPEHSAPGESLQAIRDGRPADPLVASGEADLTAHVDFAALAAAARKAGAAVHGPVPQGLFLARLGLLRRTDILARTQPPARAAAMIEAARRLIEPDRMGRLFKAMAICHPALPAPPGFAE